MAFRARFNIHLPADAAAALHDSIDTKKTSWEAADRIHEWIDSGRADPDGRTIDFRARLAEGVAEDVKTILRNLAAVEPDVAIAWHKCYNEADNAGCELIQLLPQGVRG